MRAAEPSGLTLLGLVRHMADAERYWFRRQFAAAHIPAIYGLNDGDFLEVDAADADANIATYEREVQAVRDTTVGRLLDETFISSRGVTMDLRWVFLHMIEEYARHNGHADILPGAHRRSHGRLAVGQPGARRTSADAGLRRARWLPTLARPARRERSGKACRARAERERPASVRATMAGEMRCLNPDSSGGGRRVQRLRATVGIAVPGWQGSG